MSEPKTTNPRAERIDRLMTVVSGWAALILAVFGVHRWVAEGRIDNWARIGLILALGLAVTWIWGYWGEIITRLRAWRRGGGLNNAVIAVGLVVSLVLVNTIVQRRFPLKLDLTENKRFSLSPRTLSILRELDEPIQATVFVPAGRPLAPARDTFRLYADASTRFTWTHVDPLVDQTTLLTMRPALNPNTLSGAVLSYKGQQQNVTEFNERSITSAILKLTRERRRRIAFLEGHGGPSIDASAAESPDGLQTVVQDLRDLDWQVDTLDLYPDDAEAPHPDDVAVIISVAPERAFSPGEVERLNSYLNQGGRLLLLLDPIGADLSEFLAGWGIETRSDLVIGDDGDGGLLQVSADRFAHEAVRTAERVIMEPLRSVRALSPAPEDVTVTELMDSGPISRVIPNFSRRAPVNLGDAEPGPVGIMALAEKRISVEGADDEEAPVAQVLVIGGARWMMDQWASLPFLSNGALGSALVNYLGEDSALVAIPPKDENTEQAFLTPNQSRLLFLIHFWDFPLLALILAVMVYLKRR